MFFRFQQFHSTSARINVEWFSIFSDSTLQASIWSRPAAGVFSNRAANGISSGAPPSSRTLLVLLITAAHFARLLHGLLTHRNTLRSQFLLRLGIHCLSHPSTSTACHAQHPDTLPRAASSTNRKFVFRDYFAEEKPAAQGRGAGVSLPAAQGRPSRRHCRRCKEGCRGALPVACRRGWSRILTGFPTAVILFKVIFRILPSNRKRQREVRTEVRTEACTTRCCAAKSCATKSRVTKRCVDRRQLFRQIAYIP